MYSATSATNITSLINNAYLNSNASAWVYKQADEASYLAMMDGSFASLLQPLEVLEAA